MRSDRTLAVPRAAVSMPPRGRFAGGASSVHPILLQRQGCVQSDCPAAQPVAIGVFSFKTYLVAPALERFPGDCFSRANAERANFFDQDLFAVVGRHRYILAW
jgi:hypothetical protein